MSGLALQVVAGQTAALALKKVKRSSLRKVSTSSSKCNCPWQSLQRDPLLYNEHVLCREWSLWTALCTPRHHGSLMQT